MLRIERTPEAGEKLIEIWFDGLQRFGERQAERFQQQIDEAVFRLAEFPEPGTAIDHIKPGYRVYHRPFPIHIIYRYDQRTLTIVKIFHGQQNWDTPP